MTDGIIIEDCHGEGMGCALCDEDGTLRVSLMARTKSKAFVFVIGPSCRLMLEGGLRSHRKWEIRGGREIVKEKMRR